MELQAPGAEGPSGAPLFCVLRGPGLLCYGSAGEAEAGQEPTLTIAVTKAPGAEGPSGAPLFCVLRGPGLLCYGSAGEAEAGQEPTLTIAVTKDTRVRALEAGGRGQPPGVAVTNRLGGEEVTHALLAESAAEAQRWLRAFGQHLYDLALWDPTHPYGILHIPVGPSQPSRTPEKWGQGQG
uniref:rhotekin n=1 Tax=Lonchura striata TaxID=40157 RepID=UPI000B4C946E|nr:rhotekin [Lonchura striata domestica]